MTARAAPIYQRAVGFGFPIRVDGNDVFARLAVTRKALQHAREVQGPTQIEAYTYRMGAHTTSDDPTRYRTSAEIEEWRRKDPIARLRAYLVREGKADDGFFDAVEAEAEKLGEQVRAECRALPTLHRWTSSARLRGTAPRARPAARRIRGLPGVV